MDKFIYKCLNSILFYIIVLPVSWLIFACFWVVVEHIESGCLKLNNSHFIEIFLFSIVTQQTIGYGNSYISINSGCYCVLHTILLSIQIIFGTVVLLVFGSIISIKITHLADKESLKTKSEDTESEDTESKYIETFSDV